MLPRSVAFGVVSSALLLVWILLGIPLGPAAPTYYGGRGERARTMPLPTTPTVLGRLLPHHPFWRLHFLNNGSLGEWAAKTA